MSQVYNLEPPTKGQVVLRTTHGDIQIELWPKEAPKAVRNFTQLCMEGYYDGTIFHRIIKEFMVQAGDPTGTGRGGESIYGRPFKNEYHSRIKFNHRGQVACAGAGDGDSNGSQFFITTERADELDRKYTIFGRVSTDTIFTVLRIQDVEVDDNDRPADPPQITSTEVLLPPLDDIVPRTTPAEKKAKAEAELQAKKAAEVRKRKQHGKKLNVLSFGDEAEEEEEAPGDDAPAIRYRSAHETLREGGKLQQADVGVHDDHVEQLQQRLALERDQAERDAATAAAQAAADEAADDGETDKADKFAEAMRARVRGRGAKSSGARDEDLGGHVTLAGAEGRPGDGDDAGAAEADEDQEGLKDGGGRKRDKLEKLKLTAEGKGAAAERKRQAEVPDAQLLTRFQQSLAQHRQRKRARGAAEQDVLGKLRQFQSKMKAGRSSMSKHLKPDSAKPTTVDAEQSDPTVLSAPKSGDSDAVHVDGGKGNGAEKDKGGGRDEAYDGQVNKNIDHRSYLPAAWRIDSYLDESDDEDSSFAALAAHRLHWDDNDQVADPTARRQDIDDYKVIDPLLEKGKAAFNKKQQAEKKRNREWAGRPNI